MSFQGFRAGTLPFLSDLAEHNERAWFEANRARWEADLLAPARELVEAIGPGVQAIDPRLGVEPRVGGAIFRIHRDTRFSADKRPYKEELALRFSPSTEGASGLYLRVRPAGVGFAAGSWRFTPAGLARFREAVADDVRGAELAALVAGLERDGCGYTSEPLKRVPKPWTEDHPRAALLKARGLVVGVDRPIPDTFTTPAFAETCLAGLRRLAAVHLWLARHVDA
ncbi:MAG TPA: DUF2461 domain-containing protein [Myxococcota bacterium]|nr:DUF2461 domain-containing protein [Myxococcota bacterium]